MPPDGEQASADRRQIIHLAIEIGVRAQPTVLEIDLVVERKDRLLMHRPQPSHLPETCPSMSAGAAVGRG